MDLSAYNISPWYRGSTVGAHYVVQGFDPQSWTCGGPPAINNIYDSSYSLRVGGIVIILHALFQPPTRCDARFQSLAPGILSIKAGRGTRRNCIPVEQSELLWRLVNRRFHRVVATIMIRAPSAAGARRFRKPMSRQSAKISHKDLGSMHTPTSTRFFQTQRRVARVRSAGIFRFRLRDVL